MAFPGAIHATQVSLCLLIFLAASGEACLSSCSCNVETGIVSCDSIRNETFREVFTALPEFTKEVTITNSIFREPTEEEIEEGFKKIIHLKNLLVITIETCLSQLEETELRVLTEIDTLEKLHISHCGLEDVDAHTLGKLKRLVVLNLSHNRIYHVEEFAFTDIPRLKVLILHDNAIQFLPTNAFQDSYFIEYIDLSNNNISYIHPMTFNNLTNLESVYLKNNQLETLHEGTFTNASESLTVYLEDNLWDCNCGLMWLISDLASANPVSKTKQTLAHWDKLTCHQPQTLSGLPLHAVVNKLLDCSHPGLDTIPDNVEIYNMNSYMLTCNATGHPQPSVYWKTPLGILAHHEHRKWLYSDIPEHRNTLWYAGMPTYYNSTLSALANGSLVIKQFRFQLAGEYTCVAVNPVGTESISVNVTIAANINRHSVFSIIVGFVSCFSFLFIGIIVGALRMCAEKMCKCCQEKGVYRPDITFVVETANGEEQHIDYEFDYSPFSDGTWPRFTPFLPHWSPYHSPQKCVTPAEAIEEEERGDTGHKIKDTLEDVRVRLRMGIERASGRIRDSTATVKENTSKKIQTIKESTSLTMQNIKESGTLYVKSISKTTGNYAQRVKVGVALGVTQMKSQVQSVKELCGTGSIAQTISVATVTEGPASEGVTRAEVGDTSADSSSKFTTDTIKEEESCDDQGRSDSPVPGTSGESNPGDRAHHVYIAYVDDSDCGSDEEMFTPQQREDSLRNCPDEELGEEESMV